MMEAARKTPSYLIGCIEAIVEGHAEENYDADECVRRILEEVEAWKARQA